MYKIYINDTPLILTTQGETPTPGPADLLVRYPGKSKFLLHYVDMLEKTGRYDSVTLYAADLDQLWSDFQSLFTLVEAAGGLVFNPHGALLFIFRRKQWDLPKGKIEVGEGPEEAAVREVMEETGLQEVQLLERLPDTYHTYRTPKGKRILKRTYWYRMSGEQDTLQPQAEEGIEKAEWRKLEDFLASDDQTFANLRELLEKVKE